MFGGLGLRMRGEIWAGFGGLWRASWRIFRGGLLLLLLLLVAVVVGGMSLEVLGLDVGGGGILGGHGGDGVDCLMRLGDCMGSSWVPVYKWGSVFTYRSC